jgi:hypothetical protein
MRFEEYLIEKKYIKKFYSSGKEYVKDVLQSLKDIGYNVFKSRTLRHWTEIKKSSDEETLSKVLQEMFGITSRQLDEILSKTDESIEFATMVGFVMNNLPIICIILSNIIEAIVILSNMEIKRAILIGLVYLCIFFVCILSSKNETVKNYLERIKAKAGNMMEKYEAETSTRI